MKEEAKKSGTFLYCCFSFFFFFYLFDCCAIVVAGWCRARAPARSRLMQWCNYVIKTEHPAFGVPFHIFQFNQKTCRVKVDKRKKVHDIYCWCCCCYFYYFASFATEWYWDLVSSTNCVCVFSVVELKIFCERARSALWIVCVVFFLSRHIRRSFATIATIYLVVLVDLLAFIWVDWNN